MTDSAAAPGATAPRAPRNSGPEPDPLTSLKTGAAGYNKLGRHAEALADLTRAVELEPGNYLAVIMRADCLASLDRLDEAAAEFGRGGTGPDKGKPHAGRGAVRLRQERYDEALGDFGAALELDPSDWERPGIERSATRRSAGMKTRWPTANARLNWATRKT
jgi:tetratricopeptide (TPR) repeat protein